MSALNMPDVLDSDRIVDGVRLAFRDRGTGEPVLFLHGTPSHSYIWRHVLPEIEARGYRVLAYDLLGYGRSERPVDRDTSVTAQAALLAAVLADAGLDRPVNIVGHDLGGAVAQIFAVEHPEQVRRLVMIDTVSHDSWPSKTWRAVIRDWLATYPTRSAAEFDELLSGQLAMTVADPARMTGDVLASYLAPYRSALGRWSFFEHQVRHYDSVHTERIAGRLSTLTMPVRLIWGAADEWQPLSVAHRLAAALPTAELRVLDGAGHFAMEDCPERVAAEILAGLAVA